ncbi:MAG: 2-phosphosulfolactate phosphatase [Verrucomicrobiota bacterium]
MKIDAVLSPPEIDLLPQRDLQDTTCVIFDILRATSSILTALTHGAQEIYPTSTIEEARELKTRMPEALLGGERQGERIDGFDAGNSPLEYRKKMPARIITTTTNGTVALRACEAAREVLAGALLNMHALAARLQRQSPESVLLVCAGTFRELALEDVFAAGMLCALFPDAGLSDAALTAHSVYRQYREDPLHALQDSKNGRVLVSKGRMEDVRWCAQVSCFDAVGVMRAGAIRNDPGNL